MKRTIALILSVLMLVCLLTACGGSGSNSTDTPAAGTGTAASAPAASADNTAAAPAASAGGVTRLRNANDGDPGTLTPWGKEGVRNYFINLGYETLARITPDKSGLDMCLAKEVIEVEANKIYDVVLYDYIVDQAGNPLTAEDVVFSFEKFKEAGVNLRYVSSLEKAEATDTYTVRFTLTEPKVGFINTMLDRIKIVTKAAYEASPDGMATQPVSTSPYVLKEYVPSSYALFVKADSYWQTNEEEICYTSVANVDEIYIDIIPDKATQAISLESGDIDVSGYIKASDIKNFLNDDASARDGYIRAQDYTSKQYFIIYNCSDNSPCADINLRKAIACAVDVAQVAQKNWGIIAVPATAICSQYNADYPADFQSAYSYDTAQAEAYLKDSSYKGETLKMLVYNDFSSDAAVLFQAYCAAVGINIELIQLDKAGYEAMRDDNSGTQYDLELSANGSTGYAWDQMVFFSNENYENGMAHICIPDDQLQEYYHAMAMADTAGLDATAAFCQYVDDMCYGFGIGTYNKCLIGTDHCTDLVIDSWTNLVPNACTVVPD